MTHYNMTNGSKLNVEGHHFTLKDLREFPTQHQSDVSYYGSKRTAMITADGLGDRQDFCNATKCSNGDLLWIDGAAFYLVVTDLKASNGVIFITESTFKAMKKLMEVA